MRRFIFIFSLLLIPAPVLHAQGIRAITSNVSPRNTVGKPCTVEYLTTSTQTLLDGTHITRTEKRIFYRESQGRTRDEMHFPSEFEAHVGEATHITIHDPVDKRFISLMPQSHTANVFGFPDVITRNSASTGSTSSLAVSPATSTVTTTVHASTGSFAQMQSHRSLGGQKITIEKLDGETFNGVYAEGTRTTLTRPVGAIGNDRPLVTVTDRYISPELGIEVYTKSEDPQSGERITEIKRLDRGEPDPSLFQVPEGYTVRDNSGPSGASDTTTTTH